MKIGSIPAVAQGLIGGVVALVILSIRAVIDGRTGPSFGDLWTAAAVGVAVALVTILTTKIVEWQIRRAPGRPSSGGWAAAAPTGRAGSTPGPESEPSPQDDRFDKFTDRARHVLASSQDEAQRFNHHYIGTEHLLLGLVREGEGTAARVLLSLGIELTKVRSALE